MRSFSRNYHLTQDDTIDEEQSQSSDYIRDWTFLMPNEENNNSIGIN